MIFFVTLKRDIAIALRKPSHIINPLLFFIIAISLFPLAISPEASVLKTIAGGLIWVTLLLSILLSLQLMFEDDVNNGVMEQMIISRHSLAMVALAKSCAHFILTGVPVIVLTPILASVLFFPSEHLGLLMATLILTTPTLSLIGAIGAALVSGVQHSGMLLSLIILPLYIPLLIFAAGALDYAFSGLSSAGNLYFLATMFVAFLMLSPFVSSIALKINLE